jgi:hypothetical protein
MIFCMASLAWGHHALSHCHIVRGMVVPCPVTPPHCKQSVVWHRPVGSPHHYSRAYEWSTGPALHYVHLSACLVHLNSVACPHVLQCLSGEGALVTHGGALGTREPSFMHMPAMPFFILEARRAHGSAGALPSREAGFRAVGHVALPEPSQVGRWGSELRDTWQCRSPPEQGGGVRSCDARGNTGALPSQEAGSRAA